MDDQIHCIFRVKTSTCLPEIDGNRGLFSKIMFPVPARFRLFKKKVAPGSRSVPTVPKVSGFIVSVPE